MNDDPLRVVLEREVELPPLRVRFRDWPGYGGPLVHLSTAPTGPIDDLAPRLAPRWRVLSLALEPAPDPAISAQRVAEFLELFGFAGVVLVADDLTLPIAERAASWCPASVCKVLHVTDAPSADAITAALEECQQGSRC